MRKLMFIIVLVCTFATAKSQNLTVEGTAPDLYINHIVAPKENFYSVGRLYNQAPKTIASFNNITMEKGLTIGQHVKVPLNAQNFDVTGNSEAGETLIPITHIVDKAETLTAIGTDYNVAPQLVKKWNSLSSDKIVPGSPLIIGHLKIKSDQTQANVAAVNAPSSSVSAPGGSSTQQDVASEPKQSTAPKKEAAAGSGISPSLAGSETPAKKQEEIAEAKKPMAENRKEEAVAASGKPVSTASGQDGTTASATAHIDASVETPVREAASLPAGDSQTPKNNETKKTDVSAYETGSMAAGAFSGLFPKDPEQKSLKNKSGDAATFKSTSGWQDKKYYVLMDDVNPGTIVKISAGDNSKVVYAKVLGSMPEMKENNGLLLRISNAAASSLGIIDPKFPVEVSFYQ